MGLKYTSDKWNKLAAKDPLWAVLTWEEKRGNNWQPADFYQNGEKAVRDILAVLAALNLKTDFEKILDFGCGAGRLTRALTGVGQKVWGVDAAKEMIEFASHDAQKPKNVEYALNNRPDLKIFPDNYFDGVFSLITLQHLPKKNIVKYVRELLRVLRPGGTLVFQLPAVPRELENSWTKRLKYRFKNLLPDFILMKYEALRAQNPLFLDMHGLSVRRVKKIIRQSGGRLLNIQSDQNAGPEWLSYQYVVTK